jgi:hypothetical protein
MDTKLKALFLILLLVPGQLYGQLSTVVTLTQPPAAGIIKYSPAAGIYTGAHVVTVTTTLSGGTIFCTTDGTTPTIASPRYTAPITVGTTQTLKCLAAVIYIDATNQNQNTNVGSGTFHWKAWCNKPGCDPGGGGVPSSTNQTFNVTSPVISGAGNSMSISMTSDPTIFQTNALLTDILGDCNTTTKPCTQWMHDFYVQYSCATFANLSQSEHDQFWFDNADGIRYMYGMQWDKSGNVWQLVGNSNVPWTNTSVHTALTCGTWNHIQMLTHRVISELTTKPCSDSVPTAWPCLYYDQLNLNGTINQLNLAFPANANPTGWVNQGMQHQINIFAKNATETEYYSKDNFIATGDSTTVVPARFVIQ